ncbi:MAG: AI-2E family transporter [Bacilli bacterium]
MKLFRKDKIAYEEVNEVVLLTKKILKVLLVLLFVVGIYAITLILNAWKVFDFIILLLQILSPFFIGIFLAWLLNPLVKFFQKKGLNRILSTIIVYAAFLVFTYLLIVGMLPLLLDQLNDFVNILPAIFKEAINWVNDFIDRFQNIEFINIENFKNDVVLSGTNFIESLTVELPKNILTFLGDTFSAIGTFIIGIIVGFYMLFDFDSVEKTLLNFLPKRMRKDAYTLYKETNNSLLGYVKGTLATSLLIFVLSSIIFMIIGLKAPLLLGMICAITNIIPYLGPYIGAAPAILVGFTQGVGIGIATTISILIVQFIEGSFIHPLVMSKTMKLHPVTILIGLLVFGYFFGIIGMIIAAPLMAIIKVIANFIDKKYNLMSYSKEE